MDNTANTQDENYTSFYEEEDDKGTPKKRVDNRLFHAIAYSKLSPDDVELYHKVEKVIAPYAKKKDGLLKIVKQGLEAELLVTEIEEKDDMIAKMKADHQNEILKLKQEIEALRVSNALGTTEGADLKTVVEERALGMVEKFKQEWEHQQLNQKLDGLQRDYDKLEGRLETRDTEIKTLEEKLKQAESWNRKLDMLPAALKITFGQKPELHKNIVSTVDAFLTGDTSTLEALPMAQSSSEMKAVMEIMPTLDTHYQRLMQNVAVLIKSFPDYRTQIEQLVIELVNLAQSANENQSSE